MADFREKIKEGESSLEKLMRKIPGFQGYKDREEARNADKIQRTFMAKHLSDEKSKLTDVGGEMLRSGDISMMSEIDRVSKFFDKVIERIDHADYGYSALFSSTKVDVMQLDSLYDYDLTMLEDILRIAESITAFEGSIGMEGVDPKAKLKEIEKYVKALDSKIDGRQKLLKGVE